jgi:hypothetical protein
MKFYAGIGSRQTPPDVLDLMTRAARKLRNLGFILRSGAAKGADTAFENGAAGVAEIYLPWPRFNGNNSPLNQVSEDALNLAAEHHPAWNRLSKAAQLLHARNCYQILGKDLDTPVKFVLCWHNGSGGTMQAVRLAESLKIPVFNLNEPATRERIERWLNV